jgi:hypothetical protein
MEQEECTLVMESTSDLGRGVSCTVRLAASEVLARAPLVLHAEVAPDDGSDLRGLATYLVDEEGSTVGRLELVTYDGAANRTADLEITAPDTAGPHVWTLWFPAQARGDVAYAEARAQVAFAVMPHPVRVNAWRLPVAPLAGAPVTLRVGAKGTEGALAERPFEIVDEAGEVVAAGRFGAQSVAGSSGLYDAEVVLPTPPEPRVVRWTLHVPSFAGPPPHGAAAHAFTIRTADPATCPVTVRAIDAATRAPVAGAQAVLHPYRGSTAADGVVTVPVAAGDYRLFVSAPGYDIFRTTLEVTGDVEVDAELIALVEPDPGDEYV